MVSSLAKTGSVAISQSSILNSKDSGIISTCLAIHKPERAAFRPYSIEAMLPTGLLMARQETVFVCKLVKGVYIHSTKGRHS